MKGRYDKFVLGALGFNIAVWICFAVIFLLVSESSDAANSENRYYGNPLTISGRTMGTDHVLVQSILILQLPSGLLLGAIRALTFEQVPREVLVAGTNGVGLMFLSIVFVSFVQWYTIGKLLSWAWRRLRKT